MSSHSVSRVAFEVAAGGVSISLGLALALLGRILAYWRLRKATIEEARRAFSSCVTASVAEVVEGVNADFMRELTQRLEVQLSPRPLKRALLGGDADTGPGGTPSATQLASRSGRPPASAVHGQTWVSPQDGARMVYVPAGRFLRGSRDGGRSERPRRQVHLDGYWIDERPVTVEQYRQFCKATGRRMPWAPQWGWRDHDPIVEVTWDEAAAYAAWMDKRLPSEAEWEKAARGTDGRRYPWGDEWDASRCGGTGLFSLPTGTAPAGSHPSGKSPYGCLDMAGNVLEWCADWYGSTYYQSAPNRNPKGPCSGTSRVVRSGSWFEANASNSRCAHRDSSP